MVAFWRSASPIARSYSIAFALIHAVISWVVIITVVLMESRDAQWDLIWIPFWILDFPISLIEVFGPGIPLLGDMVDLLAGDSNHGIRSVIFPSLVFGVLGPLWYGLLPLLFDRLVRPARR